MQPTVSARVIEFDRDDAANVDGRLVALDSGIRRWRASLADFSRYRGSFASQ